jgi:hypothetical protein
MAGVAIAVDTGSVVGMVVAAFGCGLIIVLLRDGVFAEEQALVVRDWAKTTRISADSIIGLEVVRTEFGPLKLFEPRLVTIAGTIPIRMVTWSASIPSMLLPLADDDATPQIDWCGSRQLARVTAVLETWRPRERGEGPP